MVKDRICGWRRLKCYLRWLLAAKGCYFTSGGGCSIGEEWSIGGGDGGESGGALDGLVGVGASIKHYMAARIFAKPISTSPWATLKSVEYQSSEHVTQFACDLLWWIVHDVLPNYAHNKSDPLLYLAIILSTWLRCNGRARCRLVSCISIYTNYRKCSWLRSIYLSYIVSGWLRWSHLSMSDLIFWVGSTTCPESL